MSARKLRIVGFSREQIDYDDDSDLASLIAHLDESFFKKKSEEWHLKIMDEKNKEAFSQVLNEYLEELGISHSSDQELSRRNICDQLLSLAIDLIYSAHKELHDYSAEKVRKLREAKLSSARASINPLDAIDCNDPAIISQIHDLCSSLGIMTHPNPEIMLRAACRFIEESLSEEKVQRRIEDEKQGRRSEFSFKEFPVGLDDQKDVALNAAARCLRLLSFASLRDTQTQINETLAAIQNLTTDAKK